MHPINILIVEDNPGDSDLVTEQLSQAPAMSFKLETVATLAGALQILSTTPIDALLLDLNLPDCTGLETLRRILAVAGTAPVIVVTGHVDEVLRREALALGAEEVLAKEESNTRLFSRAILYVIQRSRARDEHRELEGVLSTTPDAIFVVSLSGEVQYVNQAALVLFDRAREEFVGELLGFSVKDDARSEVTILRGGSQRLCEMRVVQIEWRSAPAFLASLRDITEQRRMEAQLALSDRMVSIGTLAAGVAHEINNPLASVMANLDLALAESTTFAETATFPSEILEELRDARDAAERVRQIVLDLKMFSRAEDDKCGPVDVHKVIESTVRIAWNEIRHRARLVKHLGSPPLVNANEARLGQVILNLLVNAAQAIPEGSCEENEIRITTGTDTAGWTTISISDTGGGIPLDVQKRMFTAFFTTKPVGEGTGLGLAISQRIVASFGGHISFESQLGQGTRFMIALPPSQGRAVAACPPRSTIDSACERGRILVVDDDVMIAHAVKRILSPKHDVTMTDSAGRALGLLRDGASYHVVLCDLMMPQVSGLEFYEATKGLNRALERRIVFMTGGAFTLKARAFLDGIPNRCVQKPFDVHGLRTLIDDLVR